MMTNNDAVRIVTSKATDEVSDLIVSMTTGAVYLYRSTNIDSIKLGLCLNNAFILYSRFSTCGAILLSPSFKYISYDDYIDAMSKITIFCYPCAHPIFNSYSVARECFPSPMCNICSEVCPKRAANPPASSPSFETVYIGEGRGSIRLEEIDNPFSILKINGLTGDFRSTTNRSSKTRTFAKIYEKYKDWVATVDNEDTTTGGGGGDE